MPNGTYYNFSACELLVELTGTLPKDVVVQLSVGWLDLNIHDGETYNETTNTISVYYIIPFLTDSFSSLVFDAGINERPDKNLPASIDTREANEPFQFKSSHDITFEARLVIRYV